jgi:hypothetical protein
MASACSASRQLTWSPIFPEILFVLVVDDLAQLGIQIAGLERVGLFRRNTRDLRAGRDRGQRDRRRQQGKAEPLGHSV